MLEQRLQTLFDFAGSGTGTPFTATLRLSCNRTLRADSTPEAASERAQLPSRTIAVWRRVLRPATDILGAAIPAGTNEELLSSCYSVEAGD
jgi:hypothetical protein